MEKLEYQRTSSEKCPLPSLTAHFSSPLQRQPLGVHLWVLPGCIHSSPCKLYNHYYISFHPTRDRAVLSVHLLSGRTRCEWGPRLLQLSLFAVDWLPVSPARCETGRGWGQRVHHRIPLARDHSRGLNTTSIVYEVLVCIFHLHFRLDTTRIPYHLVFPKLHSTFFFHKELSH